VDDPGVPGTPERVVPVASSAPRPFGRQASTAGLLTSVPDPLAAANARDDAPAGARRRPLSSKDEASTSASGARSGRTRTNPVFGPP